MDLTILIILIALLQFSWFTAQTGLGRLKYGIDAPKTVGNLKWESIYRVQQNTMEHLVVFIPSMLTFQMYVSQKWVIIPGITFIIGRQIYAYLYVKDPKSRGPGMILSFFSNLVLIIGSLIGVTISLLA